MLKNQFGIIKFAYVLILVFLGVLLWLYWQGSTSNLTSKSVKLDSGLTYIFLNNGISDADILAQSRQEKVSGISIWVEYYKEIKLPEKIDVSKLLKQIKKLVVDEELDYSEKGNVSLVLTVEIRDEDKLFSKIVFFPPGYEKQSLKTSQKRVAIVIDDLGYKKDISDFLNLGIPITFAILPREMYSKHNAKELKDKNMPYILHLPLEPEKYPEADPGPYALLIKMNDKEIKKIFKENLESVPGVVGVSNHMGSKFSADEKKMRVLLNSVKASGLFYLDSYTTHKSKAKKVADDIGLKCIENEVFLDLEDTPEYMKKQFDKLIRKVEKEGECIAIGHIQRKNMVPVLKDYIPKFRKNNIEFVYLTDLLK
ncbi:MAG: divergent polysaccharide deacetylase family protein [Endomicrobiales bacterium]|nr:divergent polysaccharide deacetylase family protein [Endomicrobiales bacterium]